MLRLVGRGNLSGCCKILIYNKNTRFYFLVEYLLEYLHQNFIEVSHAAVIVLVELEDRVT